MGIEHRNKGELDDARRAAKATLATLGGEVESLKRELGQKEAAASYEVKGIAQLQSALLAETLAKDAANSKAEELERLLSAETVVRAADR